ncbi:hypothetical protein EJ06DRAFT_369485 [Trichodelitschia bisporula]|uniref:Uncharacterized protein n=1 Tax=Trichodelitschia bisporula TaxID=703511 RepID=A0A6G1I1U7_9PEZI|nr:hypothetical protein EJ06DRAFT_369485 [Trichodelitschia bisporula]
MALPTSTQPDPRTSRLSAIQDNIRSLLRDMGSPASSSLYSRSPNPNAPINGTPRARVRGFFGRVQPGYTQSAASSASHLPLNPPLVQAYSPASNWDESPTQPAPAVLPSFRHPSDPSPVVDEDRDLEAAAPARRHRRRKRRAPPNAWVRKPSGPRRRGNCLPMRGPTRGKALACFVSGVFLAAILTTYLTIALTVKGLGQELHVLFILTIVGTLIFFVHSLIRVCILHLRPKNQQRLERIPSVAGPEGFQPTVPIRVHLARDEEIVARAEDGTVEEAKLESLKAPPPAYGLWRCSVRVNPALLHWQRVGDSSSADGSTSPQSSQMSPVSPAASSHTPEMSQTAQVGPRPPSYVSDDGVDYIVTAAPRSTVLFQQRPTTPSDIHPAFRIRLP